METREKDLLTGMLVLLVLSNYSAILVGLAKEKQESPDGELTADHLRAALPKLKTLQGQMDEAGLRQDDPEPGRLLAIALEKSGAQGVDKALELLSTVGSGVQFAAAAGVSRAKQNEMALSVLVDTLPLAIAEIEKLK